MRDLRLVLAAALAFWFLLPVLLAALQHPFARDLRSPDIRSVLAFRSA